MQCLALTYFPNAFLFMFWLYFGGCFLEFLNGCFFFRFESESPGTVFVKEKSESEETAFSVLLPNATFPDGRPAAIPSPGLPLARQQYLYRNIRQFL